MKIAAGEPLKSRKRKSSAHRIAGKFWIAFHLGDGMMGKFVGA
jgi:hypothetical protein